ncbi:hypothetical protein [uncultured Amnibacterium sp.]|uniref:hypothetical protein n=1 Tax=uncultured Amnibacterium sp. TaxID=1631851 RepID=UPI0035CC6C84
MRRTIALFSAACLAANLAVGVVATAQSAQAADSFVSARTLLNRLKVVAEYEKEINTELFDYGDDYDADHDGCSTRKEVLLRDAISIYLVTPSCRIEGKWKSLYNNLVSTNPHDFEINRQVSINEAWRSCASKWTHRRGVAFNNDIDYKWSLQLASYLNGPGRGNRDPANWLPAKNHCTYVKGWVGVKARWGLSVDSAEKAVLLRELSKCKSLLVEKPGLPDLDHLINQ